MSIAAAIIGAIIVGISSARSGAGLGCVWSAEHGTHHHDASGRDLPCADRLEVGRD